MPQTITLQDFKPQRECSLPKRYDYFSAVELIESGYNMPMNEVELVHDFHTDAILSVVFGETDYIPPGVSTVDFSPVRVNGFNKNPVFALREVVIHSSFSVPMEPS